MSSVPDYRIKIARAKRHLEELKAEVQAFLASEPYEAYAEDGPSTGQRHAKVRVKRQVPSELSAIVGDIIHNARAALDLLMVAVVKRDDPGRKSYNHVHFVIRDSKEAFEADLPKNIKGASAEARQIIEELKPYRGGNEDFYRLHQLDILDKHKAIIPVGAAHRSVAIAPFAGGANDLPEQFRKAFQNVRLALRPADRQFPLKDGATVFSAPTGKGTPFDDQIDITVELAFGEGQILEGEPLDPAIANVISFVEGVCDTIEKRALSV